MTARLATLPARLSRRRLGPAARGDKHRGSGKRCRSGVQRTHLTAVPTELHACLMRAPASASPSIGPHSRPQHGREQRDQGHRLAATAQELPLIWCVHGLLIARGLALLQTCVLVAGATVRVENIEQRVVEVFVANEETVFKKGVAVTTAQEPLIFYLLGT